MIFIFRTAFWFSLVLAFVPPGFKITADHEVYEMILEILPDHMAEAVVSPDPVPPAPNLCDQYGQLCSMSDELGLLLDYAGDKAEQHISGNTSS